MYVLLFSLLSLLVPTRASILIQEDDTEKINAIINEIELALDNYFDLLDNQDIGTFMLGVKHASRAHLLLEQYLGEDVDKLEYGDSFDEVEHRLKLIARRVEDLSSDAGRELWRQDHQAMQDALLRLSELDNLVKGLKVTTSN